MKTLYKALALAAMLLSLAACNRKITYEYIPYAVFTGSNVVVDENVGTVSVPIKAYNLNTSGNLTVRIIDGTAKAGTHVKISNPANGVLTFNGSGAQEIVLEIVNNAGVFTGTLSCELELVGTDAIEVGVANKIPIEIRDLDHPLSKVLGDYAVTDGVGKTWTMSIAPDEEDMTKVWFANMVPYNRWDGHYLFEGKVATDLSTITISYGQTFNDSDYDFGIYNFYLQDGKYYYSKKNIVLTVTDEGLSCVDGWWLGAYGVGTWDTTNCNAKGPVKLVKK